MLRRKIRVYCCIALLAQLVLFAGAINSAYAFTPPPTIKVFLHFDLDTAKGIEKGVVNPNSDAPAFILRRGTTGTLNLTFTSSDNEPANITSILFGGEPPYNNGWADQGSTLPEGIIYSIQQPNVIVAPNSSASVKMRISVAPNTAVRIYNLTLSFIVNEKRFSLRGYVFNYRTVLTVEKASTTTKTSTNAYSGGMLIVSTVFSPITKTQTITVTSTTTQLSPVTSTLTTTLLTTLTNTITATFTERVADSSIYAWAASATAAAVVLAVVLLMQRRTK